MITFKSPQDLTKLPATDPAYLIVQELIDRLISAYIWEGHPYNSEGYRHFVLLESTDTTRILTKIWDDWRLLYIPWKGIGQNDGFFTAIFLANNEYGLCFVIPDADWVDGKLREVIEEHLDP